MELKESDKKKYNLTNSTFTKAMFNYNENGENNIISSMNEYTIIWDFNKIKNGIYNEYNIFKVNEIIIENQFKNNSDNILITMPNIISIQKNINY